MRFANREEAGRLLAQQLEHYKDRHDVVVLGLVRGGVPIAFEVAKALHAPLDVFILRKLGVPGHEELAFGAIASGGVHVLDQETIDAAGLSPFEIGEALTQAQQEMERREGLYRSDSSSLKLTGKTAILVDDGIATGSSMRAAIAALRKMKAERIVIAVPVAPLSTYRQLRCEADDVVCSHTPESFYAVGAFYDDFSQVTDEEVIRLLSLSKSLLYQRHAVHCP
jgi:putative phosphoribosyl transferase